jgi:hypothetical protein
MLNLDLDSFDRNVLSSLAKASDKFLEIGVHVLKNQIQDCLAFFILPLFHVQQSIDLKKKKKIESYLSIN